MKKLFVHIILLIAVSCNTPGSSSNVSATSVDTIKNEKQTIAEPVDTLQRDSLAKDEHNAQNALDWSGSYSGRVVSNSKSYLTQLTLNDNLTWSAELNNVQEDVEEKGTFTWFDGGSSILLSGGKKMNGKYFVGENVIIQYKGNEKITDDQQGLNTLVKTN